MLSVDVVEIIWLNESLKSILLQWFALLIVVYCAQCKFNALICTFGTVMLIRTGKETAIISTLEDYFQFIRNENGHVHLLFVLWLII